MSGLTPISRRRLVNHEPPRLKPHVDPTTLELLKKTIVIGVTADPEPCNFALLQ